MLRFTKWISIEIHQSWLVVFLCVGIILGVIMGLVFRINFFSSFWWISLVLILCIIAYIKPNITFAAIILMAGMVLAFFRCAKELEGGKYLQQFVGINVVVSGVIAGDTETDDDTTKFKLVNLAFGGEDENVKTAGNMFVSISKNEDLKWGDEVALEGKMLDGFGTYGGYMYKPKLTKWKRPEPGLIIIKIRDWFAERIKGIMPEPEVSLGLSYLVGMKSRLDDDLNNNLRTVGLVHIVVASGAHLAILVDVAKKVFGRLSRFVGMLFSVLFVLFFMCMVGWTPSIMRAGIMTILNLVAWYYGRKITAWRLILMVAAITLVIEPMFIINLGWLLSFASYSGIMIIGPILSRFFYGNRRPGLIASTIVTTISATMMTLPITLYYYGTFSLISVVANLLILPTLPLAMGLVFLVGVFAEIPFISLMMAWSAKTLLDFHITVVEWFAKMHEFLIEIPKYQNVVWLIYVLIVLAIIGLIVFKRRRHEKGVFRCNV